jgi:hypothetical protein
MIDTARCVPILAALLGACAGAPPPPIVHGQAAYGVALPCYHVESPGRITEGTRYTAVDEQGLLQMVEVTRSGRDETCSASSEPEFAITFEDLEAEPMISEADQPYARCTDSSGLFGSHAVGRNPKGVVLLVSDKIPLAHHARVLRPLHGDLDPPPPSDHPFVALDADGNGAPDHLLFYHGKATETRDPDHDDMHFSTSCLDVYALAAGAWSQLYSACAESCEPVTY